MTYRFDMQKIETREYKVHYQGIPANMMVVAAYEASKMSKLTKEALRSKAEHIMDSIRKNNTCLMVYIKGGEFVTTKPTTKLAHQLATDIPECVVGTYTRMTEPKNILYDMMEVLGVE